MSGESKSVDKVLEKHRDAVTSVSWSPLGDKIVSGSYDTTIIVWDSNTGEPIGRPLEGHTGYVLSVDWYGDKIVSGSFDKTLRLWNSRTGTLIHTISGHRSSVKSVSFSPDGSHIVSGSSDHSVRVWDMTGTCVLGKEEEELEVHASGVQSVDWHGDKIVSGSGDNTVRVWDMSGKCVLGPLEDSFRRRNWVSSVSFSPDGSKIAAGSADKIVRIWDMSGKLLNKLKGHEYGIFSVDWHGDKIVSGSWDKTVRVWDSNTGAELLKLEGHTKSVSSVSWSPQGDKIASGSADMTVRVWDVSILKEWENLQHDILSWKLAWGHTDMPFALMLQKAVWYVCSLEKLKVKAVSMGFKMALYDKLYTWCNEYIRTMKNRQKKMRRLRF